MSAVLRILKMPWLATVRTPQRWLFLFIWFILAVDVSKALPIHGVARQFGIAVLITTVVAAWKMVFNTLWLARDARALRLPGVERDADSTLVMFALASVVLPALILGDAFGHPVTWLVSLALVAMATLAFCILPVGIMLPVFSAATLLGAFGGWRPPFPGDPAFLAWAVPALIVLGVASLQRWIALRRAPSFEISGWLRPTSLGGRRVQLRRLRGDAQLPPAFDSSLHARVVNHDRFGRIGPNWPVRSIRTALSARLAPFDVRLDARRWRRWQTGFWALPVLAMIALLVFRATITPQPLLTMIAVAMIAPTSLRVVADAWRTGASGLSVLTLLPHVTAPARVERDAIATCMAPSTGIRLWFAAVAAMAMVVLHWPALSFVYLALMLGCGLLLDLAIVTNIVGGRPLPVWVVYALYFSAILGPLLSMQSLVTHRPHAEAWLATSGWQVAVCMGLWLAWCLGFLLLALRGWRALRRRAHPFLSSPSK